MLAIDNLEGQRDSLRAKLDGLERLSFVDPKARLQIPQVQKSLASVKEQLKEKEHDRARLDLTAPASGTVLPPPEEAERESPDEKLPTWSGTPLEPRNAGAFLAESTLFVLIGDPRKMEAKLVIDQADVEFVAEGQRVDIKLDELPGETLEGEITEISPEPLKVSPKNLSNKSGGELATKTDESGMERPLSTSYQVTVPLDDPEGLLRIGLVGRGRVHAIPQTLGQRRGRYLSQTFNFRL
jgi:putative peptide zinc metalloprotease protein